MPAQKLYQKLLDDKIIGSKGLISFNLKGISIDVRDVSIVGNVLQEWLGHYMLKNHVYFREKNNTQEFPDFLLDTENADTKDLLEVKAFMSSPNFDIANFSAYARSLRDYSYRLDAKYLIFRYKPIASGIEIEDIWLKNVWEICGNSGRSPVNIQWKQGDPVNIRPVRWYSDRTRYKPFDTRRNFVKALASVIGMARIDQNIQRGWFDIVSRNYRGFTGNEL